MRQLKSVTRRTSPSIVIAAWTLGLAACSRGSTGESVAGVHGDLSANPANVDALSSRASCDALLAELRDHLLSQVVERAEQARALATPEDIGIFSDPASGARAGAPHASTVIPGPDGPSAPQAPVQDIDRGDIVKTDADLIYLLHGSALFVLDAEPAAATEILATAAIEGQPLELVVNDRRVVVFSAVSPTASESGDESATSTKLTVLDVGSGTLEVLREFYVEGVYNSARIDGDLVRAVLTHAPKPQLDTPVVSYVDVFGHPRTPAEIDLQVDVWALLSIESIEDSTIGDYVPSIVERVGGTLVRQSPSCDDYLLPEEVPAEPRLTTVVTLDLGTSTPLGNFTAFGDVGVFDAGPGAIIVAQSERVNGDVTRALVKTNLQRLSLGEHNTSGVARVAGSILNIDESNGVVRVLTIQNRYTEDAAAEGGYAYAGPSIRVVTLAADGMTPLGQSADLTGDEYVSSSYFSGDRAYLATAGQTTGLAVVDLSDAAAPAAVGQVHATSRIFQLHPLSTRALLALGQTADPSLELPKVAFQLFDVSEASAPRLANELVFDEPGYTDALYGRDVLGINSTRDVIALPFQSYSTGVSSLEAFRVSLSEGFVRLGGVVPPATDPTLHECLELLGYPTDPEYVVQIAQDPAFVDSLLESCRSYATDEVRRGLFRGEALFAIGERSVTAYALDALAAPPLSQINLDSSSPTTSP